MRFSPNFRNLAFVAGAVALLAACVSEPSLESSNETEIRIGRLSVIVDHGFAAKAVLAPDSAREAPAEPADTIDAGALDVLYVSLEHTVTRHLALQSDVCALGLVAAELCEDRFHPSWLDARRRVTGARLDRWSDEAQDAILPLWSALCEKAIAKTGNKDFCAIE